MTYGLNAGGVVLAIAELIRSIIKPKLLFSLSINSRLSLYSLADVTEIGTFTEGDYYLSLRIKCKRKEIGNLHVEAIAYLHQENQVKNTVVALQFEPPPEVLESEDEVILKCLTAMDFQTIVHPSSKINIKLTYDYAYTYKFRMIEILSNWSFSFANGKLISNDLQCVNSSQKRLQ